MKHQNIHMVTGAFGFSGKYIARELLAKGYRVATITNSPRRPSDLAEKIEVKEFNFDRPQKLVASLSGIATLYNTYWVRFNHRRFSHQDAVDNTLKLFAAAKDAGVKRIVHTSITNPSLDSELEYFRGKSILEKALVETGISFQSFVRRSYSGPKTSWSTTLPGCCAGCRYSRFSGTEATGCSLFM